ncbi:MAG: hypothetical protein ACE5O2_06515 [Armatimonadota bacterium]
MPRKSALLVLALLAVPAQQSPLTGRWVGTHNLQPLYLDFHGDTMLVVNDLYVVNYLATPDSLYVMADGIGADTAFAVRYWFSQGKLLLATAERSVITMSPQDELARPLHGFSWEGSPSRMSGQVIRLQLFRGGIARWRLVPEGEWVNGEWDRTSRVIEFTWLPDSTLWVGRHDPRGEALLFDETFPGAGAVVLRRVYR